jgi:hypothetical protein
MILALLCALALPALAQSPLEVDPDEWRDLHENVGKMSSRMQPAAVAPGPVKALFETLLRDSEQEESEEGLRHYLAKATEPDKKGRMEERTVSLYEIPASQAAGEGGARDALYRRAFSHLEAVEAKTAQGKDGRVTIDVWIYELTLDAKLFAVVHTVIVGRSVDGAFLEDEEGGMERRESPSDPAIQKRWKRLSEKLVKLRRTVEI